jgi:hypothetical protein
VFQVVDTAVSILDSTKKQLGLGADYDVFDLDIRTHINTVFLNLQQLGIGPAEGFAIEDAEATWDTFLGANHSPLLNAVKSYMVFKVKLAFDPPQQSFVIASYENQIKELEFRMLVLREELMDSATGIVAPVLPTE